MPAHVPPVRRPPRALVLAAIFGGGAVGTLSRAGLSHLWPSAGGWPWGTFGANMAGTAILAVLTFALTDRLDPRRLWRATLGAGFCGAFTTFSAVQVETIDLARDGRPGLAVAYAVTSLVAGLAVAIGVGGAHRMRAG